MRETTAAELSVDDAAGDRRMIRAVDQQPEKLTPWIDTHEADELKDIAVPRAEVQRNSMPAPFATVMLIALAPPPAKLIADATLHVLSPSDGDGTRRISAWEPAGNELTFTAMLASAAAECASNRVGTEAACWRIRRRTMKGTMSHWIIRSLSSGDLFLGDRYCSKQWTAVVGY